MSGVERRGLTLEGTALASICAGYVAWVLSLPVFPTQDGPMHLYYAHVMSSLFAGSPAVYGRFYYIKHLLPPYSAYYYLLIALSRAMPLFLADKLIVCGYIVSFVYGFRYLARAVGPAAEQATLLATILILNWPLGMGFVNFCLGVSLALWTLGVWMRLRGRTGVPHRVLFVGMCCGLVLVHPVPLLAVVGFCTFDLLARYTFERRLPLGSRSVTRGDVVCLLLALATLGYLKLFTVAHATQQMLPDIYSPARRLLQNCIEYTRGRGLSFFLPFFLKAPLAVRVYRLLLVAVVPFSLLYGASQAVRERRAGRWSPGSLWLWLTLLMIVVEPFVPHDINASHYFADRLLIFVWMGALLSLAGHASFGRIVRYGVLSAAIVAMIVTLGSADGLVRAAAWDMARLERTPVTHAGERGVIFEDTREQGALKLTGLAFNPYLWGAVNYVRHNDAVLYNTPWMDLPVIPLGSRGGLANDILGPNLVEAPWLMRKALEASPALNEAVLAQPQFVVVNHFELPAATAMEPLLLQDSGARWQCPEEEGWYVLCTRVPNGGAASPAR